MGLLISILTVFSISRLIKQFEDGYKFHPQPHLFDFQKFCNSHVYFNPLPHLFETQEYVLVKDGMIKENYIC